MLKEVRGASVDDYNYDLPKTLHRLRPDLSVSTITSLIIDEAAYYSQHKDVLKAGATAAEHYYRHGEKEGRRFFFPRIGFSRKQTPNVVISGKTIYYTTVPKDNPSWLYRCVFPNANKGNECIFFSGETVLSLIIVGIFSARRFVLLRPVYTPTTIYLIQLCRRIGVHVQIDYDDLLLPEYARQRGVCRSGLRSHVDDFQDSLRQSTLSAQVDSLTCSTDAIAVELSRINQNVTVFKNKLPEFMFSGSTQIISRNLERSRQGGKLRILYLSGSNTHKRDFSTIMGPLMRVAQDMPERFSLSFMGSLSDHSSLFRSLGVDSTTHPFVTFERMLNIISEHDLVLVPLEFSVFNHCKSNIKYIESASQGVPVIASSVAEFASSIESGVNGWLCDDESQWYETLSSVISNPQLAAKCGANALTSAKREYSL